MSAANCRPLNVPSRIIAPAPFANLIDLPLLPEVGRHVNLQQIRRSHTREDGRQPFLRDTTRHFLGVRSLTSSNASWPHAGGPVAVENDTSTLPCVDRMIADERAAFCSDAATDRRLRQPIAATESA
jgi:hypothetical protein